MIFHDFSMKIHDFSMNECKVLATVLTSPLAQGSKASTKSAGLVCSSVWGMLCQSGKRFDCVLVMFFSLQAQQSPDSRCFGVSGCIPSCLGWSRARRVQAAG